MKFFAYTRVSTTGKGQTTDNQSADIHEWAARHNHTIIAEYADYDSGGKASREQFCRMWADLGLPLTNSLQPPAALPKHKAPKVDGIVVWALDRFTREGVLETHIYLHRLREAGLIFSSVREPYLDTSGPFAEVIISLLALLAKQERIRQKERVKAGLERAKAAGVRLGRKPVDVDLNAIRILREAGQSWKDVGAALRIAPETARRAWFTVSQHE